LMLCASMWEVAKEMVDEKNKSPVILMGYYLSFTIKIIEV